MRELLLPLMAAAPVALVLLIVLARHWYPAHKQRKLHKRQIATFNAEIARALQTQRGMVVAGKSVELRRVDARTIYREDGSIVRVDEAPLMLCACGTAWIKRVPEARCPNCCGELGGSKRKKG